MLAYAGSAVSEWSSWLALLVYAEARGGSSAAGWTALGLLVPAIVVAPFVGKLADGARPIRAVATVYAVQGITLGIAAWLAVMDAPVLAVTVPAAVAIGGIAFVRPSFAVVAPALVRTARELTTANLFAGYCDSGAVLLGPLITTAVLTWGGPDTVLVVCAGLAAVGVLCTVTLFRHDRPPTSGPMETLPSLRTVLRSVRGKPNVTALLAVLGTQHLLMGFIGPMFVILAVDELDMGGSGAGALNIAFGVGAVCSTVGATVLAGRARLAPVVAAGLATFALSMIAIGGVTTVAVAIVGLGVAGMCRSLVDVTARMLLQRSAPPQYLASVFAFIEVLTSVGLAAGTMLAQLAVVTVGASAAFVVVGLLPLLVLALTARRIWRADHDADVPVVAIAVLRHNPVFSPLPPAALESVARAAVERHIGAGVELMRQGEVGESYFAISSGKVDVVRDGQVRRTLERGAGAGEVALLTDVPRTATVVTTEPTVVLEIEREPFLLAVTGHEPARDAAWRHMAGYDT